MVAPFAVGHEDFGLFEIGQQGCERRFRRRMIPDDQFLENVVRLRIHHRFRRSLGVAPEKFVVGEDAAVVFPALPGIGQDVERERQQLKFAGLFR